jgi:hypothetical protein
VVVRVLPCSGQMPHGIAHSPGFRATLIRSSWAAVQQLRAALPQPAAVSPRKPAARADSSRAARMSPCRTSISSASAWARAARLSAWPAVAVAERKLSLIMVGIGGPSPARGGHGGQNGGQRVRAPADSPRPTRSVFAGEGQRPPDRLSPNQGISAEIASGRRVRRFKSGHPDQLTGSSPSQRGAFFIW